MTMATEGAVCVFSLTLVIFSMFLTDFNLLRYISTGSSIPFPPNASFALDSASSSPLGISRPKASYAPLLNLLEGGHTGLLLVGGPCEGDGWPGCAGEHCDEW